MFPTQLCLEWIIAVRLLVSVGRSSKVYALLLPTRSDKALFWLFSLKETKDLNFLFGFPQQFYLDDKK